MEAHAITTTVHRRQQRATMPVASSKPLPCFDGMQGVSADSSDRRNTATLLNGDRSGQWMVVRASCGTVPGRPLPAIATPRTLKCCDDHQNPPLATRADNHQTVRRALAYTQQRVRDHPPVWF
jgi:hypothetical protein